MSRGTRISALCLEPPGNVARDLALLRRALFAATGEPSALLFPEFAVLAFREGEAARGLGSRAGRARLALARSTGGAGFRLGEPTLSAGCLFLPFVEGLEPLEAMVRALGGEEAASPPFPAGRGVFLARLPVAAGLPEGGRAAASFLETARSLDRRIPGFGDGRLSLYRLTWRDEPWKAASWTRLASLPLLTGPRR